MDMTSLLTAMVTMGPATHPVMVEMRMASTRTSFITAKMSPPMATQPAMDQK